MTRTERKNLWLGLLFISPWIIGFLAFLVYPIWYTVELSFTRYGGFGVPEWIGLDNYTRMLDDRLFWISVWNTVYYTGLAVPIGVVVAMVLALAMNQPLPEIPIYRAILFLPSVLPLFAVSFIFLTLLDPNDGIVNELLRRIGFSPPNWFGDPDYAKIGIVAIAQFGAGQIALVFLAGLKGIPQHLYEAAMLDGAGPIRRFFSVTLPLLTPIILYDIILGISLGMQVFTQSYIITQGGPAQSTTFYVYYLYDNAFTYGGQMGYASAMAVVLFLFTFIIAGLVFVTSKRWVHYDLS
ncbi:MAG: sugar ABC transporter permease [Chloroflexia bacterium]|nr:sugar ABC transporter permease [Chloroflexia bacterium]MDQ3613884.1 sugar ABC transporter permease [Chloroflexota bacterium]